MQSGCRDAACRVISLAGDSTQNTQIMNLVLVAAMPSFCTQIITDLEGFFYLLHLLNLREIKKQLKQLQQLLFCFSFIEDNTDNEDNTFSRSDLKECSQ